MTLEYHGAFEAGTAGCFTEDQLRAAITDRTGTASSPSSVDSAFTTGEEVSRESSMLFYLLVVR